MVYRVLYLTVRKPPESSQASSTRPEAVARLNLYMGQKSSVIKLQEISILRDFFMMSFYGIQNLTHTIKLLYHIRLTFHHLFSYGHFLMSKYSYSFRYMSELAFCFSI